MKKLKSCLVLMVLIVSACDNKLPPTKAPGAEQSPYVAGNSVTDTGIVGKGDDLPYDMVQIGISRHRRDAFL
ncbi:hypothetical protein ACVDG5_004670 [Mesorhizobium sp. ORM6]